MSAEGSHLVSLILNITYAFGGALFGSWMGHKFTIKQLELRTKKQRSSLYDELQIINEDYIGWLKILVNEFNDPLRNCYIGAPIINTKLLNNLIVELSSTDEMLSKDQRRLIARLGDKNRVIEVKDNKRDVFINDFLTKSHELEEHERWEIIQNIEFWTAQLLREATDIIFYTSKLDEERNNFIFGKYEVIEQIRVVCKYCELDFDDDFWKKVIQKIPA